MDRLGQAFLQLLTLAIILNVTGCNVNALEHVGVNYGLLGDNLPPPKDVISLYKSKDIKKLRIFDPNPDVLNALRNSGIEVMLGMKNQDLPVLAPSQDAVNAWFTANVQPYLPDVNITLITIGNEVIPGELGPHVLPVMKLLHSVISSKNLTISISTTLAGNNLAVSYPPSASAFAPQSRELLVPILKFLSEISSPMLVNVYPYFAYASDPVTISLKYATLASRRTVITDGELKYKNMFEAMYDAFVFAAEREGVTDIKIGVSESGWPSGGNGNVTTTKSAWRYNRNFVRFIESGVGTPKRPNVAIEAYIFAMFNENQKPEGVERNFGLFYPDMKPVYNIF